MVRAEHGAALVVHVVLAIEDEEVHRSRFWVRDATTDGLRPLEKYLDGLPEIRTIQDAILDRARRCDVPIIESGSLDEAIGDVLDVVLSGAERLVRT
jgi:2-phosphoglycerate kinase